MQCPLLPIRFKGAFSGIPCVNKEAGLSGYFNCWNEVSSQRWAFVPNLLRIRSTSVLILPVCPLEDRKRLSHVYKPDCS